MKFKRWLSILVMLAVLLSATFVVCAAEGDTSGGTGGGWTGTGTGSIPTGTPTTWGNSTGYRIYFARNELYYANGAITQSSLSYLEQYKKAAIYELSGDPAGSNYSVSINSGNRALKSYSCWSGGYGSYSVASAQILSMGAGNNKNTATFDQLVGAGKGSIPMWYYKSTVTDFTGLSAWANNTFGTASLTPAFLDTFCANYQNIMAASGIDGSILPHNSQEFVSGAWLIIVEPVAIVCQAGTSNPAVALSYQDYFGRNKGVAVNNFGYRYKVSSGFDQTCGAMGLVYTNFVSQKFGTISTPQNGVTAGFGLYGATVSEAPATFPYKANTNVLLSYTGDVKSNLSGAPAKIDTSTVITAATQPINRSYGGAMSGVLNPTDVGSFDINSVNGTVVETNGTVVSGLGVGTTISGDAFIKFTSVSPSDLGDFDVAQFGTYNVTLQANSEHELNTLLSRLSSATLSSYIVDPGTPSVFNYGNCFAIRADKSLSDYAMTTASGESPISVSEVNYGSSTTMAQRSANLQSIVTNLASYGLQTSNILNVNPDKRTFMPNTVTAASNYSVTVQVVYKKTNVTSYLATTSVTDGVATAISNTNKTYDVADQYKPTIDAPDAGTSMLIVFRDDASAGNYRLSVDPTGMNLTNALSDITSNGFLPASANDVKVKLASLGITANVNFVPTNQIEIALRASGDANGDLSGYSALVLNCVITNPKAIDCEMTLRDYELNYIYASLTNSPVYVIKDSTSKPISISKAPTYGGATISFNIGRKGVYSNTGTVSRNIFYTPIISIFNIEAIAIKAFTPSTNPATIVPNHAISLVRGSFGDSVALSSLYPSNATYVNYAKSNYGVVSSNKGAMNALSGAVAQNNSSAVLKVMSDTFSWTASRLAEHYCYTYNGVNYYYYTGAFSNGANIVTYALKETAFKYVPLDRATAGVTTGIVSTSLVKAVENAATYKSLSLSCIASKVLTFYPEVAMRAYYTNAIDTLGNANVVTPVTLYTMGEKARSVNPSGMYIMTVSGGAGTLASGTTRSDMPASGSAASALSASMNDLEVAYAGSGYEVTAEPNVSVVLTGYMLDQLDKTKDTYIATSPTPSNIVSIWGKSYNNVIADNSDIKMIWGSSSNDTEQAYLDWVKSVKDSLKLSISMRTTEADGTAVKTYDGLVTELGALSGGSSSIGKVYNIQVVNGVIVEDAAYNGLISSIACRYYNVMPSLVTPTYRANAVKMFKASSMYTQIAQAVEDSADADNKSQAGANLGNGTHWYDESVRTFVIREYTTTPITMSNCVASDKFDINAGPSQDVGSSDLFKTGYYAKFYVSAYLDKALINMPNATVYSPDADNFDAALNSGTILANRLYIDGADVIIADATTSDAKS